MSDINSALLDPICNTGLLNPALFPVGTAQHLDPNFNILPFLCDLLKATTDNNASPLLTNPPSAFDITPFTDFSMLNNVGDPRVSLGEVMTQTYIYFLPRVITQVEVRQNGGSRVIDNYICTSDGTPIKKSTTGPILLSLDLTGQKPFKYGAIDVPPVSATYEQLMQPIDTEEVKDFVKKYIVDSKNESAQDFSLYIENYFNGWTPSVDVYDKMGFLIVTLNNGISSAYVKYYSDVANSVGCFLGQTQMTHYIANQAPLNMALAAAMASRIPDYSKLLYDDISSKSWKDQILTSYVSTPAHEYTQILANSAMAISYFNQIASMTGQSVPLTTTTTQVSAISAVVCY